MLLDVLNLLHNFSENLGAVLRWVSIFNQTNLDVKFELVAYNLVVEPICKRGLRINNFFDFLILPLLRLDKTLFPSPGFLL